METEIIEGELVRCRSAKPNRWCRNMFYGFALHLEIARFGVNRV